MPDGIKSNLEPIDESDLDLEGKFEIGVGGDKEVEPHVVEKEVSKEVSEAEKDEAYQKALSDVQSASDQSEDEVKKDAQVVAEDKKDAEGKIQNLVDLALEKGVKHAVGVARHLDDNYVLDVLHDKLITDELHNALVQKGLVDEK